MTDDELDRLDALCAAATPGPWDNVYFYVMADVFRRPNESGVPVGQCFHCADPAYEPVKILKTYHVHRRQNEGVHPEGWHRIHNAKGVTVAGNYDYEEGGICKEEDAALIVASREAIPSLVAEVRRLRAGITEALEGYDHRDEISAVDRLRGLVERQHKDN